MLESPSLTCADLPYVASSENCAEKEDPHFLADESVNPPPNATEEESLKSENENRHSLSGI